MKLENEILLKCQLQYYHEQVFSAADRAKRLSDTKLIVKLTSSSVGGRIFRDLRSEINIPSEEKISADGQKWKIALKQANFTDIDICKLEQTGIPKEEPETNVDKQVHACSEHRKKPFQIHCMLNRLVFLIHSLMQY